MLIAGKLTFPHKSNQFSRLPKIPPVRHICIDSGFTTVALGGPVDGVANLTSCEYKDTHISSWMPTRFPEWKTAPPGSFFEEGLQFPTGAIYKIPSLRFKNLPNKNGYMSKLLFIPDKARVNVEAAALPMPNPLVPRVDGIRPAPPPPAEPKATPPTKANEGDPSLNSLLTFLAQSL